jgi:hypothetical protein
MGAPECPESWQANMPGSGVQVQSCRGASACMAVAVPEDTGPPAVLGGRAPRHATLGIARLHNLTLAG